MSGLNLPPKTPIGSTPPTATTTKEVLQVDSTESNNKVVNLEEQERQQAAADAAKQTSASIGSGISNPLTGEEFVKREVDKPAVLPTADEAGKPAEVPEETKQLPIAQLIVLAEEHVQDIKTKLLPYAGKPGYNPFFQGKEVDEALKQLKRMITSGNHGETAIRQKALSILKMQFKVPDVTKRKFEPSEGY